MEDRGNSVGNDRSMDSVDSMDGSMDGSMDSVDSVDGSVDSMDRGVYSMDSVDGGMDSMDGSVDSVDGSVDSVDRGVDSRVGRGRSVVGNAFIGYFSNIATVGIGSVVADHLGSAVRESNS